VPTRGAKVWCWGTSTRRSDGGHRGPSATEGRAGSCKEVAARTALRMARATTSAATAPSALRSGGVPAAACGQRKEGIPIVGRDGAHRARQAVVRQVGQLRGLGLGQRSVGGDHADGGRAAGDDARRARAGQQRLQRVRPVLAFGAACARQHLRLIHPARRRWH
jgi:hypothetical protein